jgi:hypothetical protein
MDLLIKDEFLKFWMRYYANSEFSMVRKGRTPYYNYINDIHAY